jgi:hypothetical protein
MSIEEAERKTDTETGQPPSRQTSSLTEIRKEITTLIKSNAVHMVQKTIDQVNEGHYAAMKYLFEAIGLFPAPMQEEMPAEDSLVRRLLGRLGLPEDPMPETNVRQGREPDSATRAGDAVE